MATEPNALLGGTRALVGQGLMMGWGDEAEAWLRSKLSDTEYKDNLRRVQGEYAQFTKQYPLSSAASEFAGAVAPGVAMMFVPGMQPAGAATTLGGLARLAAATGLEGAVGGAGSAEEGRRAEGALTGGAMGTVLGPAVPVAMRGAKGATTWLRERLFPTEALAQRRATEKFARAMAEEKLTPQQIEAQMAADRAIGVPSVVANVNPALSDLAEAVAQRTGRGARQVEKTLAEQKLGARERTYQQVSKGLKPGDYYADEQKMIESLRAKADPAYEGVFAKGEQVDDPVVNAILQHPTFQDAYRRGQKIAESKALAAKLRGESDYEKYLLPEIYKPTGKVDTLTNQPLMELQAVPNLRTLDYVKRGLDDLIDAGFRGQSSVGKGQASALKDLRNQFRDRLDQLVPEYRDVRKMYAGDMEIIDAMRAGINDFGKMDHEQVIKAVAGMSDAEKDAFRTGVARDLYAKIMNPSGNFNAAQRIVGSPEMQAKLQPLFDSPAQFDLFKNSLLREAQLFNQANKVLGGSQTGKRTQMREALEEGPGVGEAVANAVTGGFWGSLTGMVARSARSSSMTEPVAERLSKMLMSKDPHDVAAVVKLLEEHATQTAPRAVKAGKAEAGAASGVTGALHPTPADEADLLNTDIERDLVAPSAELPGPDIEADIENGLK